MNSSASNQSSTTPADTSPDSTASESTKSTNCCATSSPESASTSRQVHNPEGVTEPPPAGYRLLYADEVPPGFTEGNDWLFWTNWDWDKCYEDGDSPDDLGIPHWTYAVPVDWVRPKTAAELHEEIAALRAEIAELKRHLSPPVL